MISVIVPIYNVEKYLDVCVQSVLRQTYRDFELILVDDGSTDKSGIMCDQYAKLDKRIRVIHKENGGPSEARNIAAAQAKGEYITFIDSDDYVGELYLQALISGISNYDADICAVLMMKIDEGKCPKLKQRKKRIYQLTGEDALLNMLYQKDLDTTPCGMLFRKSLVVMNPFPIGRFHEDDFTMYKYFEMSKCVVIVKSFEYYYVQHDSSIMHTRSDKILHDEIDASDNLEIYFDGSRKERNRAARSKKFSNYCQILLNNPELKNDSVMLYDRVVSFIKKERIHIVFNKNTRIKNKIAALLLCLGVRTFLLIGKIMQ